MITVQFKLLPLSAQEIMLQQITKEYIYSVNALVDYCCRQVKIPKLSSASFRANLPSAVKNEVCNTVKSILRKYQRGKCDSLPVLQKPIATWNNQNYKIADTAIEVPIMIDGKVKRVTFKAIITEYQRKRLSSKLGSLRITQKNGKWIAQVAVQEKIHSTIETGVMGIDLGLKVPAVAVTDMGKTRFCGNGRMNKYVKRKHRAKRKVLGRAKKQKAINKLDNKEQRWMHDQDHKISRSIVSFAISQSVGTIRMEQLQNIRQTTRTSRKNEKNLHTWSFYRLAQFIEYKAKIAGIEVEYVNPAYTSQKCPICNKLNRADDRNYTCVHCGFNTHRDRLGAINILSAPVISGSRKSA